MGQNLVTNSWCDESHPSQARIIIVAANLLQINTAVFPGGNTPTHDPIHTLFDTVSGFV